MFRRGRGQVRRAEAVGVPPRFGVSTLLAVTAMYAMLFALMKLLGARPVGFVVVATFVTGVGLAQALLFGGKQPRRASFLAGAVLLPSIFLVLESVVPLVQLATFGRLDAQLVAGFVIIGMLAAIPGPVVGGAFGYVAGCLIAGIFLRKAEREFLSADSPQPTTGWLRKTRA